MVEAPLPSRTDRQRIDGQFSLPTAGINVPTKPSSEACMVGRKTPDAPLSGQAGMGQNNQPAVSIADTHERNGHILLRGKIVSMCSQPLRKLFGRLENRHVAFPGLSERAAEYFRTSRERSSWLVICSKWIDGLVGSCGGAGALVRGQGPREMPYAGSPVVCDPDRKSCHCPGRHGERGISLQRCDELRLPLLLRASSTKRYRPTATYNHPHR